MLAETGSNSRTRDGVALGLILAMEVPNLYSAPLPSKFTIATFAGSTDQAQTHTARWIRSGEIEATIQAIILGTGGSLLTSSPWPFLIVLAMVAWKLYSYEDALGRGGTEGLQLDIAGQGGGTP
jgi:hypothetical protein